MVYSAPTYTVSIGAYFCNRCYHTIYSAFCISLMICLKNIGNKNNITIIYCKYMIICIKCQMNVFRNTNYDFSVKNFSLSTLRMFLMVSFDSSL